MCCKTVFFFHAKLMNISDFKKYPPFGADGICQILSNPSELKRMTAHDFKDLLQVNSPLNHLGLIQSNSLNSVLYQCSMDSSQSLTTPIFWTCCLNWVIGTAWQNFICTLTPAYKFYAMWLHLWAAVLEILYRRHVVHSRHIQREYWKAWTWGDIPIIH